MIKKFRKQLDVDASTLTRSLCDSLNRTSEENCSIQVYIFSDSLFYLHVRSKHKTLNLCTQALLLLRRPPCWKSTARQSRTCRVEPSSIWAYRRTPLDITDCISLTTSSNSKLLYMQPFKSWRLPDGVTFRYFDSCRPHTLVLNCCRTRLP